MQKSTTFAVGMAGAAALMLSGMANAATTVSFFCITGNSSTDCAIGEAQLTVDVTDLGGGQVNFRFNNSGPAASAISEVYFDDGTLLGLGSVTHSDGDPWTAGSANPPVLPGGNSISPPFIVTAGFLAESNPPPPQNGVRPGEYLDVVFGLQAGKTYADVITDLTTGDLPLVISV